MAKNKPMQPVTQIIDSAQQDQADEDVPFSDLVEGVEYQQWKKRQLGK